MGQNINLKVLPRLKCYQTKEYNQNRKSLPNVIQFLFKVKYFIVFSSHSLSYYLCFLCEGMQDRLLRRLFANTMIFLVKCVQPKQWNITKPKSLYIAVSLGQNLYGHFLFLLAQKPETKRRKGKPKYSFSKISLQNQERMKQYFVSYNYQYLTLIKKEKKS